VDVQEVRRFVLALDKRVSYPAEDAELSGLKGLVPEFKREVPGVRVLRELTLQRIVRVLQSPQLRRTRVAVKVLQPARTVAHFGPVIVIRRGANELRYYAGAKLVRRFGVATGQAVYPTPTGTFSVVDKQLNPWWRPPDSPWAEGLKPIPPGPGNPLGTRWMGLSAPGVGIHGTPDDASIGYSASHGCIRMHISDAEWLFHHVNLGTPVVVTDA
jgi:lipoprotein-anchoring transpeptidase ErfK/SrfK